MEVIDKTTNRKETQWDSGDVVKCMDEDATDYFMIVRNHDDKCLLVTLGRSGGSWYDKGNLTTGIGFTVSEDSFTSIAILISNLEDAYLKIEKVHAKLVVEDD